AATMCAGYEQMFRSQGQRAEQLTHAA
ncbi:MAG: hypothetical protein JWM12_3293, partial [Ilumatobacteraceae bacterium]|nr:hypothetical protein [Ilumatobacteraceae bacterium]